jgi:FAD/FMN-containing dehydrogenase
VSVDSVAAASALLADLRRATNDALTSFEYIGTTALALLAQPPLAFEPPLDGAHQLLIECAGDDAQTLLEQVLGDALAVGAVADVAIAHNDTRRAHMWRMRESIPAAEKLAGGSVKHDIAVPLSAVPAFVNAAEVMLSDAWPDCRACIYGHLGDGNVHLNVLAPLDVEPADFLATQAAAISAAVHRLACAMDGSFSAEHGVGALKRDALNVHATPVARALMRTVKRALDPHDLMNPGKLVPALVR